MRYRGVKYRPVRRARRRSVDPTNPLEADVQVRVIRIYASVGCDVYEFSQARETRQTPGIPDLYVIHPTRGAWWHEVKRPKGGRVRPAQKLFRERCLASNTPHVIGDADAAYAHLKAIGLWVLP